MQVYLNPTQEQGRAFFTRDIAGGVVMLNLLRFRDFADYSESPALMPTRRFLARRRTVDTDHTLPYLKASGGEILFYGRGGSYFIGPIDERWMRPC